LPPRDNSSIAGAPTASEAHVLGEQISVHLSFWVGAAAVLLGAGVFFVIRKHLVGIDVEESELDEITEQPTAITVGSDS
jgi:hypothetical protein